MGTLFGRTLAAGVAASLIGLGGANAATERTDWVVTSNFKSDTTICSFKFSVPKETYTMTVEVVTGKKEPRDLEAKLTVGGLPRFLEGKKGFIRDLQLNIDTLRFDGIKANWNRGDKDNNSRIVFTVPATELVPVLAAASKVSVDFELSTGWRSLTYNMSGSARPAKLMTACVAS